MSGRRRGRSRRQSSAARCRRRGRKCPQSCGHECTAQCGARCSGVAGTGDARSVAAASRGDARSRRSRPGRARRGRRRARREAPARGDHGGPARDAVEPRRDGAVPATAVSAASRRASGARSDRRERRREGYPPEGPRPRSGLGRVARSRSDAPRLIGPSGTPASIIGTSGFTRTDNTVGSIVVVIVIGSASIVGSTVNTASVSTIIGSPTRCGARAAEPPRSAAPQAPCDAKASRAVVAFSSGADQKETGRAAGATRPVWALRVTRPPAGPGCPARRPCRRGCR